MKDVITSRVLRTIFFMLIVVVLCPFAYGNIIYVDEDGTLIAGGSSWQDAYICLKDALAAAQYGDEIRVAEGTYKPDQSVMVGRGGVQVTSSGDRTETFQLINGVSIEGGYAGFGWPDPDARDIELYETILSGDLGGNDGPNFTNNTENSYHIVTGSGTNATAVLDGFAVTAGNANGSNPDQNGGGMYCDSGSPTLTNCTITGNRAYYGGGVYNAPESSPTIINCTFNGNYASRRGGGLFNQFFSSPTLTNCEIVGNTAGVEGFIYGEGGGMFNRDGCNPLLINCIITGNLAKGDSGGGGGGGICTWNSKIDSSQIFINCSFAGNSAPRGNSLSYDSLGKDFPSTVQLTNCILWDSGNKIWNNDDSTIMITFSNVQGLTGGRSGLLAGNINEDPLFVDADGTDDVIGTEDDNLRLFRGSLCIDAGDNSAIPQSVVVDLDGNPRIINGIVDMGAYEWPPTANVYYVDADSGDNSNDGLSLETAFATIQKGIDAAVNGEVVLVYPGLYQEEINFLGKALTVQGVAAGPAGVPVLQNPGDFAVSFYYGEGPDSVLKNFIIRDSFMGVFIAGSSPTISNLTIVDNKYGIEAYTGSEPDISNCIFWNNSDDDLFGCEARYSCIERGGEGEGNIYADPLFVDTGSGDYHLLSERGRYWPEHDVWVLDKVTSPCVDGGDPNAEALNEPMPNGGRINIGAYGGTPEASLSLQELSCLPCQASNPSPANGAVSVETDVILSWTAGLNAVSHDVYFGTDDSLSFVNNQTTTQFDPGMLDVGTTYFWCIDEINSAGRTTGTLWTFTTEPIGYAIENVTATASNALPNMGPENTVNGSGIDADDLHSTEQTDMWLSGSEPEGAWIEFEFDRVYKLHEMWVWNSNQKIESMVGFGCKGVTIEYSADGNEYTTLGTTHEFAQAPGTDGYAHNTTIDFGGVVAKNVRLTISSNWGFLPQYSLSEVRFTYIPPQPPVPPPPGPPSPPPKNRCFLADTPVWVNGALVQISNVVPG